MAGTHQRYRIPAIGLWATVVVATGCGSSPAATVTASSGGASTSQSVTLDPGGTLALGDAQNGSSAAVAAGQRLTVTLTSTDWHFASPSAAPVLRQEGQPAYSSKGPSCPGVPGTGCGTVVVTFTAVAAGETDLSADRTTCGEALRCSESQAHWRFHVRVSGPVPVEAPVAVTTTAVTATTATGLARTTIPTASTSMTGVVGATGVQGTVIFGPVCPVERVPPDPQCAPRPGVARVRLLRPDGSAAADGVSVAVDGRFSIPVAPGTYVVTAAAGAPSPGGGCQVEPPMATVVAGPFVTVNVTCDTGIR